MNYPHLLKRFPKLKVKAHKYKLPKKYFFQHKFNYLHAYKVFFYKLSIYIISFNKMN